MKIENNVYFYNKSFCLNQNSSRQNFPQMFSSNIKPVKKQTFSNFFQNVKKFIDKKFNADYGEFSKLGFLKHKSHIKKELHSMNISAHINSNNIKVADKILSSETLRNNQNVRVYLKNILDETDSKEKADLKLKLIDKLISNEKLYKNEEVKNRFGSYLYFTDNGEKADNMTKVIDKFLSDKKFFDNNEIKKDLSKILFKTCTNNYSKNKEIVIEEIFSNKKYSFNKS